VRSNIRAVHSSMQRLQRVVSAISAAFLLLTGMPERIGSGRVQCAGCLRRFHQRCVSRVAMRRMGGIGRKWPTYPICERCMEKRGRAAYWIFHPRSPEMEATV